MTTGKKRQCENNITIKDHLKTIQIALSLPEQLNSKALGWHIINVNMEEERSCGSVR